MSKQEIPDRLVRSVQQSLQVEGYDVSFDEVKKSILQTMKDWVAREGNCCQDVGDSPH
jgi:hypothetical protein